MGVRLNPGDTELIRTISGFLGEFAAEGKLEHANDDGVDVIYSKVEPRLVRFRFVTFDDLELNVDVQLADVTRQYLENMLNDVLATLERRRTERADSGVAGAIRQIGKQAVH